MRKRNVTSNNRGDTIIEVLFAVTVFSFVATGGIALMNKGTALAQRALEIGLVRQQMDSQADALRYLSGVVLAGNASSTETDSWDEITSTTSGLAIDGATGTAKKFGDVVVGNRCTKPNDVFALDWKSPNLAVLKGTDVNAYTDTMTFARINNDVSSSPVKSEGVWVQTVKSKVEAGKPGFYDFHIRACWLAPGQDRPITLGTIVRLYEPRE